MRHATCVVRRFAEPRFGAADHFIVRHYAGEVTYAVRGFLRKNNDSLSKVFGRASLHRTHEIVSSQHVVRHLTTDLTASSLPGG